VPFVRTAKSSPDGRLRSVEAGRDGPHTGTRAFATSAFPITSVLSARRTVSAVGSKDLRPAAAATPGRGVTVNLAEPRPADDPGAAMAERMHQAFAVRAGQLAAEQQLPGLVDARHHHHHHHERLRTPVSLDYHTARPEGASSCFTGTLLDRHRHRDQSAVAAVTVTTTGSPASGGVASPSARRHTDDAEHDLVHRCFVGSSDDGTRAPGGSFGGTLNTQKRCAATLTIPSEPIDPTVYATAAAE
jgi:hypothetical protein